MSLNKLCSSNINVAIFVLMFLFLNVILAVEFLVMSQEKFLSCDCPVAYHYRDIYTVFEPWTRSLVSTDEPPQLSLLVILSDVQTRDIPTRSGLDRFPLFPLQFSSNILVPTEPLVPTTCVSCENQTQVSSLWSCNTTTELNPSPPPPPHS